MMKMFNVHNDGGSYGKIVICFAVTMDHRRKMVMSVS
jgi:hypothetical protein